MKKIANALLVGVGLIIGFICFVTLNVYDALHFDPTMTLGNFVQASATILVGLTVAAYFQRHTQSERKEKDILLRNIDLILDAVRKFEDFKDGGELIQVTAVFKQLSVTYQSAHDLLVHLNYPSSIVSDLKFNDRIKELKKLTTDTPYRQIVEHASQVTDDNAVRDGIIRLASEKKLMIDNKTQELKSALLRAEISVNKA